MRIKRFKNTYLRRLSLVIVFPFLVPIAITHAMLSGAIEVIKEVVPSFKQVWRKQ